MSFAIQNNELERGSNMMDREDLLNIFQSVCDFSKGGIESVSNYNTDIINELNALESNDCLDTPDTTSNAELIESNDIDRVNDEEVQYLKSISNPNIHKQCVDNLDETQDMDTASENCKGCGTDTLAYEDGAYFCHTCGVFQEVRINQEQEWRFYGDSDSKSSDPTRVGMPMNKLLPESSLGTVISNKGSHSVEFEKLRQYHTWNTMPYKERSLYRVYERLQSKALKAGIPICIIENAKSMYKQLSEAQISRGANRRGLMASCIYIACKMENVPRSAKEIADIYDLKVSEMTRGCKKFIEIMNLTKIRKSYVIGSSTPMNFIKRFCSKLGLSQDIYHICEYVAYATTKLDIVDENTPPSIAAGSIFLVMSLCNINVAKRQVAQACKISEVTISKCYKKLYLHRQRLFPPSVIKRYNIELA